MCVFCWAAASIGDGDETNCLPAFLLTGESSRGGGVSLDTVWFVINPFITQPALRQTPGARHSSMTGPAWPAWNSLENSRETRISTAGC